MARTTQSKHGNAMIERVTFRYEDLAGFPDDGLRRELLGGELYVSPAPTPLHQRLVVQLVTALAAYARENGGEAFVAPLDIAFTQTDVVEPDVFYVSSDRAAIVQERAVFGVPNFVVEVVSPASSELDPEGGRKYRLYAGHGVPEYWVVHPRTLRVQAFTEPDSAAQTYRRKTETEGSATVLTLPNFAVTLRS